LLVGPKLLNPLRYVCEILRHRLKALRQFGEIGAAVGATVCGEV
jgi:hypothetical protein